MTLVEVLAALLILALGLTVILGMFARGGTYGSTATGENVMSILAPMAAAEIEKFHRDLWDQDPLHDTPDKKGGIDTTEFDGPVANVAPRFWPRRYWPGQITPLKPNLRNSPYDQGGVTYCARYTLRKLCDNDNPPVGWSDPQKKNMNEQTRGMYVLTLCFYRVDPKQYEREAYGREDDPSYTVEGLLKNLVQVGHPVVLYLSDARND